MLTTLRSSTLRAVAGGAMALLGAGIFVFALPSAARRLESSEKAAKEASAVLKRQEEELKDYQAEAERIRVDRKVMDELLGAMPAETVGNLQWKLSQRLFELAGKHGVHLVFVKYGAPAKEGAKDSLLEAVDVEFTVFGIFQELKAFMLDLEGGRLPFAVVSAKLDEAPEGAHLTVTLRAFRRAPGLEEEKP